MRVCSATRGAPHWDCQPSAWDLTLLRPPSLCTQVCVRAPPVETSSTNQLNRSGVGVRSLRTIQRKIQERHGNQGWDQEVHCLLMADKWHSLFSDHYLYTQVHNDITSGLISYPVLSLLFPVISLPGDITPLCLDLVMSLLGWHHICPSVTLYTSLYTVVSVYQRQKNIHIFRFLSLISSFQEKQFLNRLPWGIMFPHDLTFWQVQLWGCFSSL